MSDNPAETPTEAMAARISKRLEAVGKSARRASIEAGLSDGGIMNLKRAVKEGRPFSFRADSLAKLARVLLTTEAWLLRGEGPEWAPQGRATPIEAAVAEPIETFAALPAVPPAGAEVRPAEVELPPRSAMPQDVPVYGTAAGSLEGAFQIDGVVEYVRRPPGMTGVRDLYAIYVVNSSMEPEHHPGDLRFVHPGRPVRIGDTVVVQTKVGEHGAVQAYIKKLAKLTPDSIVLVQHNPPTTIEIKRPYVLHMHRVLSMNELFGV